MNNFVASQTTTLVVPRVVSAVKSSVTYAQATRGARNLYRTVVRALPGILNGYELNSNRYAIRSSLDNIREFFEANRDLKDPQTIDVLRWKGEMELNEALELIKTKPHILYYVERAQEFAVCAPAQLPVQVTAKESKFMSDFFEGKN
mmetsp:Transcript_25496/g.28321  ORF Transcript_25496/g.28321 Transcript_25496/m.28321 type:complete len:147 (+) Transcript_25496:36-476(+)